jgi:transcriptional regulator with XRE-family HTH domain
MVYNKNVDYVAIGKRVKELRSKKEMSQEQLATCAEISTTYLSNIENAHSKASLSTFIKIANALGCGVDALLCDNIKESRPLFEEQLGKLLEDCSQDELKIIVGTVKGLKEQIRAVESLSQNKQE